MKKDMEKIINCFLYCLFAVLIFSTTLSQLFTFLLILFWLSSIIQGKRSYSLETFIGIAVVCLIFFRLLSVPFSVDFKASLKASGKVFFYLIFFVILDNIDLRDKSKLRRLLSIFFYTAVLAASYGTGKYLLSKESRIMSTTGGWGTLGMYLTAVFAPVLYLGGSRQWFSGRLIWWIGICIILTGIILTFGRIHWLITFLFVLLVGLRRERKILVLSILVLCFLFFFHRPFRERILTLRHPLRESSGRDVLWQDAMNKLGQRPVVGYGLNTFKKVFTSFDSSADKGVGTWHNEFLQMYMESGLPGFLAFLGLFLTIFLTLLKLKKTIKDSFYLDLGVALGLSFLAFFLTCFTGGFMLDPNTSLQFFILAGILGKISYIYGVSKNERSG